MWYNGQSQAIAVSGHTPDIVSQQEGERMLQEFKDFIGRGNVIDLAVAVIIGGAFGAIISSLVDDIIMPLVGVLLGGIDFSSLSFVVRDATVMYGNFIQGIVNFLIISLALFLVVRSYNKLQKEEEAAPAPPPEPSPEEVLLAEIRDLIKAKS
jgi:large conductance mechanosensitive channel